MSEGRGNLSPNPAKESVYGVEESGRWSLGFGSERALGLRPATGWPPAARSRGSSSPRPGPAAAAAARRLFLGPWHRRDPDRRAGDLGHVRLLSRAVRRARHRLAL